ncbi:MAG: hypothetical protein Q9168_005823 [Polycauliona sp. 1 TL-2023]
MPSGVNVRWGFPAHYSRELIDAIIKQNQTYSIAPAKSIQQLQADIDAARRLAVSSRENKGLGNDKTHKAPLAGRSKEDIYAAEGLIELSRQEVLANNKGLLAGHSRNEHIAAKGKVEVSKNEAVPGSKKAGKGLLAGRSQNEPTAAKGIVELAKAEVLRKRKRIAAGPSEAEMIAAGDVIDLSEFGTSVGDLPAEEPSRDELAAAQASVELKKADRASVSDKARPTGRPKDEKADAEALDEWRKTKRTAGENKWSLAGRSKDELLALEGLLELKRAERINID